MAVGGTMVIVIMMIIQRGTGVNEEAAERLCSALSDGATESGFSKLVLGSGAEVAVV